MGLKRLVRSVLTNDALVPLWRGLAGGQVAVQFLHRFSDPELGVEGITAANLRASLAYLRKHRIPVTSLGGLLASPPSERAAQGLSVAFTVDDGYADFARVAAPVFAEFDCPVSVFLVTGAVDGTCWYWWDRVEFAVESTERMEVELDLFGTTMRWRWEARPERRTAIASITESLKVMPNEQKELTLTTLAERLEVSMPARPTPRYSAMSWGDVRRCAAGGVTFGSHTVTHPILPAVADAEAKWEVLESWRRLRAECDAVVPVFAYPSGIFSVREVSILAESGLVAALTTTPHYAKRDAFRSHDPTTRYAVPRFSYNSEPSQFVQVVTGIERLKLAVRSGRHAWRSTQS